MTNSEYTPYFYVVAFLFTAITVMLISNMNWNLSTQESLVAGVVTGTILLIVIHKIRK